MIKRHKTREVIIGKGEKQVVIGGDNLIAIQSMCNTKTLDIEKTVIQIHALEDEKCDIVRVGIPNIESALALPEIIRQIHIPIVADIHFDHRLALLAIENGADKIRINPGNIKSEAKLIEIIEAAKKADIAIRIGVNAGSLEKEILEEYGHPTPEALAVSAERSIKFFEKNGFEKIVVSIKTTDVLDFIETNKILVESGCDYPIHIGVTEAGIARTGSVRNAIGVGTLLQNGIGDTMRVSLTADPVIEVQVAKDILKALHLYKKEPIILSCPTCARTEINVEELTHEVTRRTAHIKDPIKIVVMGCAVNGPGESKEADYGIAGGMKQGALYRKGEPVAVVPEANLVDELIKLIENDLK